MDMKENKENSYQVNEDPYQNSPVVDNDTQTKGGNIQFLNGIFTGIAACIIVGAIAFSIWFFFGQHGNQNAETEGINYQNVLNKLQLLEYYIDQQYLEEGDVANLEAGIYKGLLSGLEDPYSTYYTQEEYESLKESTNGVYYGIGAYVHQDTKTGVITIAKPFKDGPAYNAGVLPGDILYAVEGQEVTGMDLTAVVNLMKGKENTNVTITIMREGVADPFDVTVVRGKVEVPTIEYEMMEDSIGYIAITEFDKVTATQFRSAITELEGQGMKGLVIDLRDNPGGLLDSVVDMLDRMVKEGMLVYTKDKNGNGDEYKANDSDYFDKPLAVLINGNSASASEVFAGAIQDYGIGTLVGTTSYGKGIVQNVFPLTDGSAVKLTVSKYYTPNGRNIHGIGIEPDVEVELDENLKQEVEISKSEDNQLQKAIEVVKEKLNQ